MDFERRKYICPDKGKIENYKKIIASGNIVIAIYKQNNSNGEPYSTIGRVWENKFGGGKSETHQLDAPLNFSGVFVVKKEVYETLLAKGKKIKK